VRQAKRDGDLGLVETRYQMQRQALGIAVRQLGQYCPHHAVAQRLAWILLLENLIEGHSLVFLRLQWVILHVGRSVVVWRRRQGRPNELANLAAGLPCEAEEGA